MKRLWSPITCLLCTSLPVEEVARRTYRRYSGSGGLRKRAGHGGERLPGRLEQRHERFARICVSIDGRIDPDQHKAVYAARYVGGAEPVAGY